MVQSNSVIKDIGEFPRIPGKRFRLNTTSAVSDKERGALKTHKISIVGSSANACRGIFTNANSNVGDRWCLLSSTSLAKSAESDVSFPTIGLFAASTETAAQLRKNEMADANTKFINIRSRQKNPFHPVSDGQLYSTKCVNSGTDGHKESKLEYSRDLIAGRANLHSRDDVQVGGIKPSNIVGRGCCVEPKVGQCQMTKVSSDAEPKTLLGSSMQCPTVAGLLGLCLEADCSGVPDIQDRGELPGFPSFINSDKSESRLSTDTRNVFHMDTKSGPLTLSDLESKPFKISQQATLFVGGPSEEYKAKSMNDGMCSGVVEDLQPKSAEEQEDCIMVGSPEGLQARRTAGTREPSDNVEGRGYHVDCLDLDAAVRGKKDTINSFVLLGQNRKLVSLLGSLNSSHYDTASYGHDWILHHKRRELEYSPWQVTLTGKMEKLRLAVIAMYWDSARLYNVSLASVYVAIHNFGRLIGSWSQEEKDKPAAANWATTAFVALRLALKMEERPEMLWDMPSIWDMFPLFREWSINKSDENLNKKEMSALGALGNSMDMPLSPMFLSMYLSVGGWPEDLCKDYKDLGFYLLALCTFATHKDQLLKNVAPSRLALAALVLAIKIINGDRGSAAGILSHRSGCPRNDMHSCAAQDQATLSAACDCRYEFFPERLQVYCNLTMADIQPVIRGLSCLLRSKPEETGVLKHFFPIWGENDWQ